MPNQPIYNKKYPNTYLIVSTLKEVEQLVKYIKKTKICSFDFETTSLNMFSKDEAICTISISFQPYSSYIIPLFHFESPFTEEEALYILRYLDREVFTNPKIIKIAHNLKFEFKWLKKYGCDLQGILMDNMVAKYYLDENTPMGLKENVAMFLPDYSGYEEENTIAIKKHGGWRNVPLEVLAPYNALDSDLTLRLMLYFHKKLIEHGFYSLFRNLRMMAVKMLAETEFHGMRVNRKYLNGLIEKYKDLIEEKDAQMRDNPRFKIFVQKRRKNLIRKWIAEVQAEIDKIVEEGGNQRLIINRQAKILKYNAKNFTKGEIEKLEFNLGSPKQITEFFYTDPNGLNLPIVDRSESGNPSTAEATLLKIKKHDKSGFIDQLLELRALQKLDSTYISGMVQYLDENDYVHASYKVAHTVTHRLSCSEPNMQNLPRFLTNPDVRRMFEPPEGFLHNANDYGQAELRIAAELSKDKAMIDIFERGYNIHVATAVKAVTGTLDRYMEVHKTILKDENHPENEFWERQKKNAKTINFGILYGQGDDKLAEGMGVSLEEAKQFKNQWFSTYPQLVRWIKRTQNFAKKEGYVKSIWGYKRRLPDIWASKKFLVAEALRQCVDQLTEALTKEGWKDYSKLKEGELILTKNPTTGILEWQPIQKLNIYPDFKGTLYHFKNNSFDALTTKEHRWLVNSGTKRFTTKFKTSEELYESNTITPIHRSGKYLPAPKTTLALTNDYCKLLGLILTDGHIRRYKDPTKPRFGKIHNASLGQSQKANPHKVKIIDDLIESLALKGINRVARGGSIYWRFPQNLAIEFDSFIPNKKLTPEFLLSLNLDQLKSLRDGMLLGDGCRAGNSIITGKKDQADMIQMMNVLLGTYSNINERDQMGRKCYSENISNKAGYIEIKNKSYQVSIGRRTYFHHRSSYTKEALVTKLENQEQLVWCPTVENQAWVCRRNGKQYITGNSVNAPIQGAASDFTLFSAIIHRKMRLEGQLPPYMVLRIIVHDDAGYWVKPQDADKYIPMISSVMFDPPTEPYFGFRLKHVKMKASSEIGPNLGDKHDYVPGMDLEALAKQRL